MDSSVHSVPWQTSPAGVGEREITAFLSDLAVTKNVAASTQNQALSAILFLCQKVLDMTLDWLEDVVRAKRPKRLPTVLTRDEVHKLVDALDGTPQLIARLTYGTGPRMHGLPPRLPGSIVMTPQ